MQNDKLTMERGSGKEPFNELSINDAIIHSKNMKLSIDSHARRLKIQRKK